SKYIFTQNGEKIFKVVTFFVMNYLGGDLKFQQAEISKAGWFEPDEALKILSFNPDKYLLKRAIEIRSL
ncbi:hypothetical protein HY389_00615, partial [Candidatus Daviesbacteria bacterium]|nr:hypothetical protein [Candidatus Daviesbacteria bacterium]